MISVMLLENVQRYNVWKGRAGVVQSGVCMYVCVNAITLYMHMIVDAW